MFVTDFSKLIGTCLGNSRGTKANLHEKQELDSCMHDFHTGTFMLLMLKANVQMC